MMMNTKLLMVFTVLVIGIGFWAFMENETQKELSIRVIEREAVSTHFLIPVRLSDGFKPIIAEISLDTTKDSLDNRIRITKIIEQVAAEFDTAEIKFHLPCITNKSNQIIGKTLADPWIISLQVIDGLTAVEVKNTEEEVK